MTGALLPPGADTVVPVEDTDREADKDGFVRIRPDSLPKQGDALSGRFTRPPGEEAREGEVLARPGDSLDYRLLAHLAAAGIEGLRACPAPRVSLLVTGSELVEAGDRAALAGGVMRADILSPSLSALIRISGGELAITRRCGDREEDLAEALRAGSENADLLITTGGASMGESDLVKRVLVEIGGSVEFWGIRMRPGSPVSLATLPRGDRPSLPVLGLPGNPVSAIVTFLVLGIPALRSLGGHHRIFPRTLRATLREPLPGPRHLTRFPRVRLVSEGGGIWGAHLSGEEGSGVIRGVAGGDGVAILPEGTDSPSPGETVEVILFPGAGWTEAWP
jgi:molybdopterin molybdotransferase